MIRSNSSRKCKQMVNWSNVKLVYGDNTLDHIAPHKVSLSEVHNVLVLIVILEPAGTNEMLLITAFDAPDSKKNLYRKKTKT